MLSTGLHLTSESTLCLFVLIVALAAARPASTSLLTAGADMAVWALSMASLYTLQQQRAIAVNPRQSNLRLALNNSAMYLGASIGSAFGGIVILRGSLAVLPLASAVTAAMGLALLLLLRGDGRGGAAKAEAQPVDLSMALLTDKVEDVSKTKRP